MTKKKIITILTNKKYKKKAILIAHTLDVCYTRRNKYREHTESGRVGSRFFF